jgi:uncharacterized protein with von Willebrand factor type A (vWA) domain
MIPLREQLIRFVTELRAAGVRVSVAESIDAVNAVAAVGLEQIRMREALAAALIKDEADRVAFDEVFGRFFAAPPGDTSRRRHPEHRGQMESAASGKGIPGETPQTSKTPRAAPPHPPASAKSPPEVQRKDDRERAGPHPRESATSEKAETPKRPEHRVASAPTLAKQAAAGEDIGTEAGRLARIREIERTPFEAYTDLTFEEARSTLGALKRRFRARLGRRLRLARAGRIDIRRTIRAAIQRGGALADLRFRARRPRHVDLLILADISGSVRYAAELTLGLAAGARDCFRRVRSFVYIDHLAEAEFEQGHLVTWSAIDFHARSDFGRVLAELWERRGEFVNRQTLVVIIGDARNNRRPARAELLREIARAARAVVWLNPEDPARWNTGDSAIGQYARAVTELHAACNLHELERALARAA